MVQFREDKQGHILWEGLREVNVKNPNKVMRQVVTTALLRVAWYNDFPGSLIREGASIRRINETDMNAKSSRSYAMSSLFLIQKKFVVPVFPHGRQGHTRSKGHYLNMLFCRRLLTFRHADPQRELLPARTF